MRQRRNDVGGTGVRENADGDHDYRRHRYDSSDANPASGPRHVSPGNERRPRNKEFRRRPEPAEIRRRPFPDQSRNFVEEKVALGRDTLFREGRRRASRDGGRRSSPDADFVAERDESYLRNEEHGARNRNGADPRRASSVRADGKASSDDGKSRVSSAESSDAAAERQSAAAAESFDEDDDAWPDVLPHDGSKTRSRSSNSVTEGSNRSPKSRSSSSGVRTDGSESSSDDVAVADVVVVATKVPSSEFKPEFVVIVRRSTEGSRPLFSRDEFAERATTRPDEGGEVEKKEPGGMGGAKAVVATAADDSIVRTSEADERTCSFLVCPSQPVVLPARKTDEDDSENAKDDPVKPGARRQSTAFDSYENVSSKANENSLKYKNKNADERIDDSTSRRTKASSAVIGQYPTKVSAAIGQSLATGSTATGQGPTKASTVVGQNPTKASTIVGLSKASAVTGQSLSKPSTAIGQSDVINSNRQNAETAQPRSNFVATRTTSFDLRQKIAERRKQRTSNDDSSQIIDPTALSSSEVANVSATESNIPRLTRIKPPVQSLVMGRWKQPGPGSIPLGVGPVG